MSIFKAIYTLGGYRTPPEMHIDEDSDVSIELATQSHARQSACDKATNWATWLVTYPFKFLEGVHNAFLFRRHQDLLGIVDQTYRGNAITPMPLLSMSFHLVSSPKLISEIAFRHFRSDPNGLFLTPNFSSFLDLLRDLFPEHAREVSKEDFLFTCSRTSTRELRSPFMEFFHRSYARERMKPVLEEVSKEILASIEQTGGRKISARELAETLSVAVLSRLCLDPTLSLTECQQIGRAASIAMNYRLMPSSSTTQSEEYEWAKGKLHEVISKVIRSNSGEFVQFLHHKGMSEIRIYGTLMLVYIAGSETTSTALHSILWRLGQHTEIQDRIAEDPSVLEPFIRDCLRVVPPVYVFTRVAREDLIVTVKKEGIVEWQYPISKGDGIMCSPYLAGKEEYQGPSSSSSHANQYPTMVFSEGPHACPGRPLAENEISTFISAALKEYVITSTPNKPNLSAKAIFTLKPEEVGLTFTRREAMSEQ